LERNLKTLVNDNEQKKKVTRIEKDLTEFLNFKKSEAKGFNEKSALKKEAAQ
jgi:hypothetical protein